MKQTNLQKWPIEIPEKETKIDGAAKMINTSIEIAQLKRRNNDI